MIYNIGAFQMHFAFGPPFFYTPVAGISKLGEQYRMKDRRSGVSSAWKSFARVYGRRDSPVLSQTDRI